MIIFVYLQKKTCYLYLFLFFLSNKSEKQKIYYEIFLRFLEIIFWILQYDIYKVGTIDYTIDLVTLPDLNLLLMLYYLYVY